MNNNEWITDRLPTEADFDHTNRYRVVYGSDGNVTKFSAIAECEPWKPIPKCEPYVKPKRWACKWSEFKGCWIILRADNVTGGIKKIDLWGLYDKEKHREAAERIAAIYEEVMP